LEMMLHGNGNEQTDLCCCHVFGWLRLFIYAIVAALLKYNRFLPQVRQWPPDYCLSPYRPHLQAVGPTKQASNNLTRPFPPQNTASAEGQAKGQFRSDPAFISPVWLLTNVFPIGCQCPFCMIHLIRGLYYNLISCEGSIQYFIEPQ